MVLLDTPSSLKKGLEGGKRKAQAPVAQWQKALFFVVRRSFPLGGARRTPLVCLYVLRTLLSPSPSLCRIGGAMISQDLPCSRVALVGCEEGAVELSSFPCLATNSIFLLCSSMLWADSHKEGHTKLHKCCKHCKGKSRNGKGCLHER